MRQVAEGVSGAHGLTADVVVDHGYAVTRNDEYEYSFAREVVVDLFGGQRWSEMPNPEMGSEDMSFVMDEVPGAYLFVSACAGPDPTAVPDNHSPRAVFDDAVVPDVAAALAELALRRCRIPAAGGPGSLD